jgi:hypothetical protein
MPDILEVLENAKAGIANLGTQVEYAKHRMEHLRRNLLMGNPKAELLWRLNQNWKVRRDPGEPINWKGWPPR